MPTAGVYLARTSLPGAEYGFVCIILVRTLALPPNFSQAIKITKIALVNLTTPLGFYWAAPATNQVFVASLKTPAKLPP